MTKDKLREIVEQYKKIFADTGYPPKQMGNYSWTAWKVDQAIAHAHWMVYEIEILVGKDKIDEAIRWLGFIQGCLFAMGMRTLNQLSNDSCPDDRT